jgi:plastocyanin
MKRRQWAWWGVLVGILWAAGCNGGGTQPPGPPADLAVRGGGGQSWYFNNPLPLPLSVTVSDLSGRPVAGVVVIWTVTPGTGVGAVNPVQRSTDANGIASTSDSVGSSTIQRVDATVSGVAASASFTEFATTPPTSGAVSVMNNFFTPDSIVVQSGSDVTWTWGGTQHTLTFTSGPQPLPQETVQSTGTKTITFSAVGTYRYKCTIHANMDGTLVVVH